MSNRKIVYTLDAKYDVLYESLKVFGQKQLISSELLGKSTTYVFNSDIVLDCYVYKKAVSLYQCLHVTTF